MAWMKRFEIWFLLVLVLGGLAWVLFFSSGDQFEEELLSDGATAELKVEQALTLRRLVAKRDYGNVRLDLEVRMRNAKGEKLLMTSPQVRLLAGEDREVPSFFLPFDPLPEVAANSTQEVLLRYWLEAKDLQGSLVLEVEGQRLLVKEAEPFEIELLTNGEETQLKTVRWAEGLK